MPVAPVVVAVASASTRPWPSTVALPPITAASVRLMPLTVVLKLEWVLRAFYGFAAKDFVRVVRHLLGLPNVKVEEWSRISDALACHSDGLDFADALHWLASKHCTGFMTFDDRRFARRATSLGLTPAVTVSRGRR